MRTTLLARTALASAAAVAGLLLASMAALGSGCVASADAVDSSDTTAEGDDALSGSTAVSRAMEWVDANLQYCQSPNHARDYDDACTPTCNRTDNPQWDPYRSDCSGLVSWAWELPAPGRVTSEFAPFSTSVSHSISASSLAPGDAVNNSDHIMLFVKWISVGHEAEFIEEPGCSTSITHAHEFTSSVSITGDSIYVSYVNMTFTAIRSDGIGSGGGGSTGCVVGGLYCGGDKVSGDSSTLYRCTGGSSGTVVDHCADGCKVNSGSDDACKASSGGSTGSGSTGSGNCVVGGLYCGGDKVSGDSSTLYRCTGGSSGTVVDHCADGCKVNSGSDDACKASSGGSTGSGSTGSGNCVVGGLYCGGDKVSGDSSTLYECTGGSSGTKIAVCSDGCDVNSGSDDSCHGSGGCVAGGLYCGGDKVSGDPSTLYRCTSGHSGTVDAHCANGCKVNSGSDDACR